MAERSPPNRSSFEEFFGNAERRIRYALCARYGLEVGREACADAFVYAWEHWARVEPMSNREGYVYRVGQRIGSRLVSRRRPVAFDVPEESEHLVEPRLGAALSGLSSRQRTVVVMVHGLGMTHHEVGEWLGLTTSTVQKHLERALKRLRQELGVDNAN